MGCVALTQGCDTCIARSANNVNSSTSSEIFFHTHIIILQCSAEHFSN